MLGLASRAYEEEIRENKKVEHIWKETVKMEMSRYHKRRLQYAL